MKRNHGRKELDQLQTLKRENDKLKKQISSLRKQLARIDLDRYSHVRDMVEEHLAQEEAEVSTKEMLHSMKEEWRCRECHEGHLEITLYNKISETWYFRKCNNCDHRTKSQVYTPSVKGIIKAPTEASEKTGFKKK